MKHIGPKRVKPLRFMVCGETKWSNFGNFHNYFTFETFEKYFFQWYIYPNSGRLPSLVEAFDINTGELRIYKCEDPKGYKRKNKLYYRHLTSEEVMMELL